MKEKAGFYLGLALLAFLFLGVEIIVLLVGSKLYGTMNLFGFESIIPILAHWGTTCALWILGIWLLYSLSKKRGFNVFESKSKPPVINWIIVIALLICSVIASYISWDMRFKPAVEFGGMTASFGSEAILVFVGQYSYYIVESALFLAIIVFGQKFGELVFRKNNVPWGGLFCGLTWGLAHILTQSLTTGIYCVVISIAFGAVYLLLKRNVKFAYPVITLMFML
ncbi:MAG: hypothetical protein FWD48_10460 [Oscillospiraceae bacterium]|nr:hypothetical protein [Oscillospiraceae bacterium]